MSSSQPLAGDVWRGQRGGSSLAVSLLNLLKATAGACPLGALG